jgi:hypothetical protein
LALFVERFFDTSLFDVVFWETLFKQMSIACNCFGKVARVRIIYEKPIQN